MTSNMYCAVCMAVVFGSTLYGFSSIVTSVSRLGAAVAVHRRACRVNAQSYAKAEADDEQQADPVVEQCGRVGKRIPGPVQSR